MHQEKTKGGNTLGNSESTVETAKDYNPTSPLGLEQGVRQSLDKYAEFLDANASYIVSEGLKFLFKKDKEFKRWLGQHNNHPEPQRQTHKAPTSKGESVQLALK